MMDKKSKMMHMAAKECVLHARGSFSRNQWNMAIRRSQEAVELELKSILAILGIDYPKDHDQAPLLIRVLKAREIVLNNSMITDEIERISADLSRKRGPALQQEEGYDKETAQKAIKDTKTVFQFCITIRKEIKK